MVIGPGRGPQRVCMLAHTFIYMCRSRAPPAVGITFALIHFLEITRISTSLILSIPLPSTFGFSEFTGISDTGRRPVIFAFANWSS
jgi:hypothetical protein